MTSNIGQPHFLQDFSSILPPFRRYSAMISSSFLAAITITVASIFNLYMEVLHINYRYEVWHDAEPREDH